MIFLIKWIKTYFNFSTIKLLGPETRIFENVAWNSFPRFISIVSIPNGSILGTLKLSPKSPVAKRGLNSSTESNMHLSKFGSVLEHVFMDSAKKINKN